MGKRMKASAGFAGTARRTRFSYRAATACALSAAKRFESARCAERIYSARSRYGESVVYDIELPISPVDNVFVMKQYYNFRGTNDDRNENHCLHVSLLAEY